LNDGRSKLISFVENFRCALCTVALSRTGPDLMLHKVPEKLETISPGWKFWAAQMEPGAVNEPG
jgi:hypothetical protein